MDEFGINSVHLYVPTLSNLFHSKYEAACNTYISAGRYELPILLHEGSNGDSFTLTTEFMHIISKGVINKVKIDDIASFQAKKSLMSSTLTAVERNGNTIDLPNSLNKNIIENVAKVLTSLVCYIHDKRSAEHMKELLENAVQEKAMQQNPAPSENIVQEVKEAPVVEEVPAEAETLIPEEAAEAAEAEEAVEAAESSEAAEAPEEESVPEEQEKAPEAEEKPKVRFCDQCGAKITSPNAKFCAECGNKLM